MKIMKQETVKYDAWSRKWSIETTEIEVPVEATTTTKLTKGVRSVAATNGDKVVYLFCVYVCDLLARHIRSVSVCDSVHLLLFIISGVVLY